MTNSTKNISTVNTLLRNKNRVLNHLNLQKSKVNVIHMLGFNENNSQWTQNQQLLSSMMDGSSSVGQAVQEISARNRLDCTKVRELLTGLYTTGLLEFHITDVCDLSCIECHYRAKSLSTFPFDSISTFITALNPKAITITGGGEPSLYNNTHKTMNDVIRLIVETFPNKNIGLINNNTHIPEGDWIDYIKWQRSSLDAANRETYRYIKGVDKYDVTIENIYCLLASNIQFVGVGFLYRDENIEQIPLFLEQWFERYQHMTVYAQAKFNIQFRPISPAIESIADYDLHNDLEIRMYKSVCKTTARARVNLAFDKFLRMQTNFFAIGNNKNGSYFLHDQQEFSHCQNALLHRILRSDGTEYPDFLICNHPKMALGNVLTANNPDDERIRISLNTLFYYFRMSEFCDTAHCRQCWVSQLVEEYSSKDISSLDLPDLAFF